MGYSVERIHEEYQSVPKELIEKVIKALDGLEYVTEKNNEDKTTLSKDRRNGLSRMRGEN